MWTHCVARLGSQEDADVERAVAVLARFEGEGLTERLVARHRAAADAQHKRGLKRATAARRAREQAGAGDP